MMNIHQVVENSRHLETLVEEQKNKIQKLEEKINNMDQVIYQFVGGLFCQRTQEGVLENYLRVLDGEGFSLKPLPEDTHKWTHWPTTRQGDECEKRISALENYMRDITRFEYPRQLGITPRFNCEEQDSYLLMRKFENNSKIEDDNDSISTHSSIHDLDEHNSVSTHSSMPSLIDCRNTRSPVSDRDDDDSTYSSMPELEEMEKHCENYYENRFRNSYEICGNE